MEKARFTEIASLAQMMKHHIRTEDNWDALSPAAKESLDQILTSIARIVCGDSPHWSAIASLAQAAESERANRPLDEPRTLEIERDIRRMVREIPKANPDAS